jgi:hypothetical protein
MFRVTMQKQNDRKCRKISELIHEEHRRKINEFVDTVGISYGVCHEIFREILNMYSIAAKSVLSILEK